MVAKTIPPHPKIVFPALPTTSVPRLAALPATHKPRLDEAAELPDLHTQVDRSAFGTPCDLSVDAQPSSQGMITVRITAPCEPFADVEIRDGTATYTAKTSLTGTADVEFPAMVKTSALSVLVAEEAVETTITHPNFDRYARIALIGAKNVDLIAHHYGQEMPIYRVDGLQLFTVDLAKIENAQLYRLVLERRLDETTCETSEQLEILRLIPGQKSQRSYLELVETNCAAPLGIQRLKNIVADLKIASN